MNILIIPSWYPENPTDLYGSFFREQVQAIRSNGHDVYVLNGTYTSLKNIFRGRCRYSLIDDNGMLVYQKLIPSLGFSRNEKLCIALFKRRIAKLYKEWAKMNPEVHIDVIHAHACYPAGFVACELGKKLGSPVVITEHRGYYLSTPLSDSHKSIVHECINSCDRFICVSNALRAKLLCSINANEELANKVTVIPNLCSDFFDYHEERTEKSEEFIFVSVGALSEGKRHAQLVRCFAEFIKEFANTKLYIIGEGPERQRLETMISENGLQNKVFLLGKQPRTEVARLLNSSDAFVLSSAYETFGVVYVEALACGLPVIATRNGGAEDIVNDNNGILVDVDNDEQLTAALTWMRKNANAFCRKQLANDAKAQYSEESVSERIIHIYSQLCRE